MKKGLGFAVCICTAVIECCCCGAADEGLVAWWKFDEGSGSTALDSVSGQRDAIKGNFSHIEGVSGKGLKCDGFTTRIVRRAEGSPRFAEGFTIEAWVAPQAYPRNWCAIANHEKDRKAGYFFGIDAFGHIGLHLAVNGKWHQCTSKATVPFMDKWSHVVGTFDEDAGIAVYIDGKVASTLPVRGSLTFAADVDLQIGRNHKEMKMAPELLVRPRVNFPITYSFDGIIDELKIYDRALAPEEVDRAYHALKPKGGPPLKWRKLPELPAGPSRFGAVYCKLKFYPEWDALWRVQEHPDIVVNF